MAILESFRRFRRALNLLAVKEFKPLGLGSNQASLIRHLAEHQPCSHADLGRWSNTDPAATGRIVDTLIRRGLVIQEEHPTDRRRWVLLLTPKGRLLAEKIAAVLNQLDRNLARPLSVAERNQLVALLDRLAEALLTKEQGKRK